MNALIRLAVILGGVFGGAALMLLAMLYANFVPPEVATGGYHRYRQGLAVVTASLLGSVLALFGLAGAIGPGLLFLGVDSSLSLLAVAVLVAALWYLVYRAYRRRATPAIKGVAKILDIDPDSIIESMRRDLTATARDPRRLVAFLTALKQSDTPEPDRRMYDELVRVHAPELADEWQAWKKAL